MKPSDGRRPPSSNDFVRSTCPDVPQCAMAYDEDLVNRLREIIGGEAGVSEQKMFGGFAFLVNGNMSIAASREGGLLLLVDPEETDKLLARAHARPFEMRGRPMDGWLRVDAGGVRTTRELERWARVGIEYARSLPKKAGSSRTRRGSSRGSRP
jgi:TfoX/Sxy family transcriptional regulator of competence genes